MGKKAQKRAELREQQKLIVERKKAERRVKRLAKTGGCNVTFKVFNVNKFLCDFYHRKTKYESQLSGYPERFVKNICVGLGLEDAIPTKEQISQVMDIFKNHNLSTVFDDYVKENQGKTDVNMRVLNGSYLILLNSKFNVTKETPMIRSIIRDEKVKKNDFDRWINTAVNKILEPLGIMDELMLVFKTEHELAVEKEKYRNAMALNKNYIKVATYCRKKELEYVRIRTRRDVYTIHTKDLFQGGPFESAGYKTIADIEEDGTIVIGYKERETDLLECDIK